MRFRGTNRGPVIGLARVRGELMATHVGKLFLVLEGWSIPELS